MFSARHVWKKPRNNKSISYGYLLDCSIFCGSFTISHRNALTEQQQNTVTIEFVKRNEKCVRRQFFFRAIFVCSAYIFFIPRQSPPPTSYRIYCCDDTIIVYCRHRRAGRRMLRVSHCRSVDCWALNCWMLNCWLPSADVPKPKCRRLSVNEIRITNTKIKR